MLKQQDEIAPIPVMLVSSLGQRKHTEIPAFIFFDISAACMNLCFNLQQFDEYLRCLNPRLAKRITDGGREYAPEFHFAAFAAA